MLPLNNIKEGFSLYVIIGNELNQRLHRTLYDIITQQGAITPTSMYVILNSLHFFRCNSFS